MNHVNRPVVIVGAGPYGVSIALELHRLRIPFVICGEPFSLWHRHTLTDASLRSDVHVSEVFAKDRRFRLDHYFDRHLPRDQALRLRSERVPVALFRDYLRQVESQLPFDIRREMVTDIRRTLHDDSFHLRLTGGDELEASQVVLACGIEAHRFLPQSLMQLEDPRIVHSWNVGQYENVRDRRVLVIGSGQSAAETIRHLKDGNRVTWAHRSDPCYYADPIALPRPIFALAMRGSHLYSMLPQWLRQRLRKSMLGTTVTPDHRADLTAPQITELRADVDELALQSVGDAVHSRSMNAAFDLVVACTGYRYALGNLRMLDAGLRDAVACDAGVPLLDRQCMTSVPGLYIVGAMAETKHGPAMRFMSGTRTASLLVGGAIAARRDRVSRLSYAAHI